jgi:NB-ARC domain
MEQLLDPKGDAVAITAALKGAGGYGKTTLARALAHDPDIQDAYFDGILWVELGEKPHNLLGIVADRVTALTGTPPGFSTVDAAATALGEALGNRRILLVVDDVWRTGDLQLSCKAGQTLRAWSPPVMMVCYPPRPSATSSMPCRTMRRWRCWRPALHRIRWRYNAARDQEHSGAVARPRRTRADYPARAAQ